MGLGSFGGGLGAARFLLEAGARVTVTDLRQPHELEEGLAGLNGLDVKLVLGEHRLADFEQADLVVPNPAVAPNNSFLAAAVEAGAEVRSEVELFLERCPARLVAITGTQGKSSTCSSLAQLLRASGFRVHLGGNIGGSLLSELAGMRAEDICVLELSSYQLEALSASDSENGARLAGCAELVAITNILADHLERHGTRESYARAKLRILELLGNGGRAILSDDVLAHSPDESLGDRLISLDKKSGLHVDSECFRLADRELGALAEFNLPGEFQIQNTLIALGAALQLGASPERLRNALPRLEGLSHRLQDLGEFRGRKIWDNGVSTTPDSTASALLSLDGSCVLLCGGCYKRSLPLDVMLEAAHRNVHCAITFGADAELLASAFEAAGIAARKTETLREAMDAAFAEARPGDALLFSPACASFDSYRNFQERALEFRQLLRAPDSSLPLDSK